MRGDYKGRFQDKSELLSNEGHLIFSTDINPGPLTGTSSTYHWDVNTDPTSIARVWDGTTTVFSVNATGDVTAKSVTIDQKDTATTALIVKSAGPSYSASLTQWKDSSGNIRASVGSTGIFNTWARVSNFNKALLDTEPAFLIDPLNSMINWGAGGATPVDVNLYRPSADVLQTDDNFIVGGDLTVEGDVTIDGSLTVEGGTVTVQDEGVEVDTVSTLNFQGAMVRATVDDDGVANIRIEDDLDARQLRAELAFQDGLIDTGGLDSWLT